MMNIGSELLIVILISNLLILKIQSRKLSEYMLKTDSVYKRLIEHIYSYQQKELIRFCKDLEKHIHGIINQAKIRGKVSEKLAERAFSLSNNTALAIMHLQKTLAVRPAYVPRKKQVENEKIQKDINKVLGGNVDYSEFDMLYTILGNEERELVDNALLNASKYNGDPSKDQ